MALETTQLLCTALQVCGQKAPYKPTHIDHPCSLWARQSSFNYIWLMQHGFALCDEYTYRYGKMHKCEMIIFNLPPPVKIPPGPITPFAQVIPASLKDLTDPVVAYRNYYKHAKTEMAVWTKRPKPLWFS